MNREEVCARIHEIGIIPAIRVSSTEDAHFAAEAVAHGGIAIVEVTMTVPGAVQLIAELRRDYPDMVVGAGTVLETGTAQRCVDAGAHFITAPGFSAKVVEFAIKHNVAALPGALTPTEVVEAWMSGADFVKVFPCAPVGGDKYIKALKASLPQIPLVAGGGVNQLTAAHFIQAGAAAIGIRSSLIPQEAIELRQADRIQELARRFLRFVKDAREHLPPAARHDEEHRYGSGDGET